MIIYEIWKDIPDYEGVYQVSSTGFVRSLRFSKTRILKPSTSIDGYLRVCLYGHNTKECKLVHRLVAETFLPNPNNHFQVNHINEFDKTNNAIYNLEWCSISYNNNYGTRNERIKTSLSIPVIGVSGINTIMFPSAKTADKYGFDHSCISKCCKGKRNQHKGYEWRYA